MTQKLELYRCNVCKNIVEVVLEGEGALVCCGEPMELLKPGTTDGATEKHVPVIDFECEGVGVKIRVGEFPHPMEPEHYIQFIEAISKSKKTIHREYLYPGEYFTALSRTFDTASAVHRTSWTSRTASKSISSISIPFFSAFM